MTKAAAASEPPKILVRKRIKASPERVFDAWSIPEQMQQWLFPGVGSAETTNDFRVGGSWTHTMLFDTSDSDCTHEAERQDGKYSYPHFGEYLEIDRPNKLVFTWNSPSVSNTRVTVEISAVEGGCEVAITHELLETEDSRKGHTDGWIGCLENLAVLTE